MMKAPLLAALAGAALLSQSTAGIGAQPAPRPGMATYLQAARQVPVAAIPAGTQIARGLAYGTDPRQQLDVYHAADARDAPILLMVHGGGWVRGDKAQPGVVNNKVAHWLPKGYVFVSANYRLAPAANPRQQAADIGAALSFVQAHARDWGGDPDRVILIGHSAGAHLVMLLAADPTLAQTAGARPWAGSIGLDSAAYDVAAIMTAAHADLYDPVFGTEPEFWRQASPTLLLQSAPAPLLLVCSTRRRISCAQAAEFARRARALGGRAEVAREDLSHFEINRALGLPGAYSDRVDAFLASLLPAK